MLFQPAALAQAGDRAAATALYDDATKLVQAGRHAEACPKLEESFKLDPTGATAFEAAQCRERLGQTATAWSWYKEALDRARAKKSPKEKEIAARVDALDKRLPRLGLTLSPEVKALAGLSVRRDGSDVGQGQLGTAVPVDPGPHTVEVTATGKKPFKVTVEARESRTEAITVSSLDDQAGPAVLPPPPAPASPAVVAPTPAVQGEPAKDPPRSQATPPSETSPSTGSTQKIVGYSLGGLGIVGLAVGAIYWSKFSSKQGDIDAQYPDGKCGDPNGNPPYPSCAARESLQSDRDANKPGIFTGFIAGGALLAGGVALVLTAPSGESGTKSVKVMPATTPGGGALQVSGAF